MTGTITLADEGQNYIEFDLVCGVIKAVRPSGLAGWKGTKVLNTKYIVGDLLRFDLQWRPFNPTLTQPIVMVELGEVPDSEWLRANMSDDKKLYVDPRGGDDRMMYEVDCEGIPFYFSKVNPASVAAADALKAFKKIPGVLLEDVDGVMLYGESKPGSPETIADIGNWFMVIYSDNVVDTGIITHEATHAWAKDKWGTYAPPFDTDYTEVIRFSGEEPITEYAKTDYAEDLAEGVRYYVDDPDLMKGKCPLRYGIIDKMMTNPNYYG